MGWPAIYRHFGPCRKNGSGWPSTDIQNALLDSTLSLSYANTPMFMHLYILNWQLLLTEYHGKCWNWHWGRKEYLKFWLDQWCLYEGSKTRVRVDSELSEEFEVDVGMHQGSVLPPFLFALVVDVATEFAREGALSELLYADDLVLMSETIEGLRNKFIKWKLWEQGFKGLLLENHCSGQRRHHKWLHV